MKQAPGAWYERLSSFLLENEFTRDSVDITLFTKRKNKNLLIIQIYVDDIIFGAIKKNLCEQFVKLMQSEFEMSMMGELHFFLVFKLNK